jgi:hypothetical protein
MGNKRVAYLDAKIFAIPLKCTTGELGPVVSDDPIRDPKSVDDGLDKFYYGLFVDFDYRGHFRALGEFVDGYVEKPVPSDGAEKHPHDIQPPTHQMAIRTGSFAASALVCGSVWHGTGTPCKSLQSQQRPGGL